MINTQRGENGRLKSHSGSVHGAKILFPLKAPGEMGIYLFFKLEWYHLYTVYALYSPRAVVI